ncbi:RNA-directed DNA polymerase from mobile element jockey, partial [Paramuricea clavata]
MEVFRSHLTDYYHTNVKDISDVARIAEKQKSVFSLTNKAYLLALTAPVTVAEDERTFSKLKLVKTLCRSTMNDERLEELLIMACEKDITDEISVVKMATAWAALKRRGAKSKYFESQVNHLKHSKPRKWWSAIKNLAGFSLKPAFHSAEVNGTILQGQDLALAVNNGFLAATKSLPPLSITDKLSVEEPTVLYPISIVDVESRLKAVKSNKAPGPDSLPNWILNNFSMEISEPVTMIFNASIKQAQVPMQWKEANVVPVPKTSSVTDISSDLRPISLTATLSK